MLVIALLIIFSAWIQSILPTLLEGDEYYHVRIAHFIKDYGVRYDFHWANFSTFRKYYSDKDFLFHVLVIPFLSLTNNIVTAGKYAIIFYNISFIIIFVFILKKYLPPVLTAAFLILPFLDSVFLIYYIKLRPTMIANLFSILIIYFLINKKWIKVFVLSLLYPLAHVSFFTSLIFLFFAEGIRKLSGEKLCARNIYAVIIGTLIGCLIHPNNPNNWLSFHLNSVLVPLYSSIQDVGLDFGLEFLPQTTRDALAANFNVFLILFAILLISFVSRIKPSISTYVWGACTSFYLLTSFLSVRYWYTTAVLVVIFFASFIKDLLDQREIYKLLAKIRLTLLLSGLIIPVLFFLNFRTFANGLPRFVRGNLHYENMANWMRMNIPAGETIFHSGWWHSVYFIALNPKNNYLVTLDPIYMFYRYPRYYQLYKKISGGEVKKPHLFIKRIFKSRYGYTEKGTGLYWQIAGDKNNFSIVYQDGLGIIFKIIDGPKNTLPQKSS